MDNEIEPIVEPDAIELNDENFGNQGWMPVVSIMFPNSPGGILTCRERYSNRSDALEAAERLAAEHKRRLYYEFAAAEAV